MRIVKSSGFPFLNFPEALLMASDTVIEGVTIIVLKSSSSEYTRMGIPSYEDRWAFKMKGRRRRRRR